MEDIVILGGGSFIGNLINYIEGMKKYNIVGYTDIKDNGEILGIPYLGTDDVLIKLYKNGVTNACMGIGNRLNDNTIKRKVVLLAKSIGFTFPIIIGRNVIIHRGAEILEGAIIRDAAIIQSNCRIGSFVMIGDNAVISHDTIIGDYSQIVSGCVIGRGNRLDNSVFVGFSSVITNDLHIVDNTVIGAKSLVKHDCEVAGLYFGQPAKLFKKY